MSSLQRRKEKRKLVLKFGSQLPFLQRFWLSLIWVAFAIKGRRKKVEDKQRKLWLSIWLGKFHGNWMLNLWSCKIKHLYHFWGLTGPCSLPTDFFHCYSGESGGERVPSSADFLGLFTFCKLCKPFCGRWRKYISFSQRFNLAKGESWQKLSSSLSEAKKQSFPVKNDPTAECSFGTFKFDSLYESVNRPLTV